MTDRELLEFAAKAAGLNTGKAQDGQWFYCENGQSGEAMYLIEGSMLQAWNPITDDGDALRLMVKLGLITHPRVHHEIAVLMFTAGMQKLEATRRAIVLAAAAIGKEMP